MQHSGLLTLFVAEELFHDGIKHTFLAMGGWHFSGTTATALMLSRHPAISGMSEDGSGKFHIESSRCPEGEGQWLQDAYPSDCACTLLPDDVARDRKKQLQTCRGQGPPATTDILNSPYYPFGFVSSVLDLLL